MTTEYEMSLESEECRRFQESIEREITDEHLLSEADHTFILRHLSECAECASYFEMIDSLKDFDDSGMAEPDDVIRDVVEKRFNRRWTRLTRMAVAAGVLFLLGGAAVWWTFAGEDPAPQVRLELAHGRVQIGNREFGTGQQMSFDENTVIRIEKDALFQVRDTLFVATESDSEVHVVRATPSAITLKLETGRMALHLVPGSNVALSVELPDGVVEVTGTVFIVEAIRNRSSVSVVRGSVAVRGFNGQRASETVTVGETYSLTNQAVSERNSDPSDQLLILLGMSDSSEVAAAEPKAVAPERPEAEARPLDIPRKRDRQPPDRPSLETLIQSASTCRAQRNWDCAVKNYESLIQLYPNRPDATTAMMPVAQILLDNLNRPAQALKYYRRYQRSRPEGSLGQEAMWGECVALRRLGQTEPETQCLKRFLSRYPAAPFSSQASARLTKILSN